LDLYYSTPNSYFDLNMHGVKHCFKYNIALVPIQFHSLIRFVEIQTRGTGNTRLKSEKIPPFCYEIPFINKMIYLVKKSPKLYVPCI